MNHIYKTVFNRGTGKIAVVSENTNSHKNHSTQVSQKILSINTGALLQKTIQLFKRTTLSSTIGLISLGIVSPTSFAQQTYNGTQSGIQLQPIQNYSGNLSTFLGKNSANGIVAFENSTPLVSNSNLLIDYSTGAIPDFVIGGYTGLFGSNINDITLDSNKLSLKKGNINGSVFSGLAHYTIVTPSIDCKNAVPLCGSTDSHFDLSDQSLNTNTNSIDISNNSPILVTDKIYAGHSSINIETGDATSGFVNSFGFNSNAESTVKIKNSTLTSNKNTFTVKGQQHQLNDLYSGYTNIQVKTGIAVGGVTNISNDAIEIIAKSDANSTIRMNENQLTSNENKINIDGQQHKLGHLFAGFTNLNAQTENAQSGHAIAHSTIIEKNENSTEATANVLSEIRSSNNILTANQNEINLNGNNHQLQDIYAGYASTNMKTSNAIGGLAITTQEKDQQTSHSAYAYSSAITENNILSSINNKIIINGNNHQLNNLYAGYTSMKVQTGNAIGGTAINSQDPDEINAPTYAYADSSSNQLTSDQNEIVINGKQHQLNNIFAGYAVIDVQTGNATTGYSFVDSKIRIDSSTISASKNQLSIHGDSTISGSLYGGYMDFHVQSGIATNTDPTRNLTSINLELSRATAINNIITLDGNINMNNNDAVIYGGYLAYNTAGNYRPEYYDTFSGNTLNFSSLKPIHVGTVANFQTYNFTLNPYLANTGQSLINAQDVILGSHITNMSNGESIQSDVNIMAIHSGKALTKGSEFILMKADQLIAQEQEHVTKNVAQQGISLFYDVETKIDPSKNQVTATIIGNRNPPAVVNPQLTAVVEGNLSGLMLLTRGADGIAYGLLGALNEQDQQHGLVPFIQMSGHKARYDTGYNSHLDAEGALLTAGLSYKTNRLTLGALAEHGWGNYDTYNPFRDMPTIEGYGKNRYYGLGLYMNYDVNDHLYLDASARGGRIHTEFKTDDLRNITTGQISEYDIDGNYLSAHLGAGYHFTINPKNQFDVSLKYLWSHINNHDLKIAGDPIHFKALDSHRLRLNGENSYILNKDLSLLTGVGFEYEFDGTAHATTYEDYEIHAPSVKGATGIASLGFRYQPSTLKNLTVDLKANGFIGMRDGGGALLHIKYAF